MESLSFDLPLLLQTVNHILVSPSNPMGQTLQNAYSVILRLPLNIMCLIITYLDSAVFAARLQSQNTEGLWHNHALRPVVGRGDTLEDLQALKSGGTACGLVGDHATDGLVEDAAGGAEVEGTTAGRVVTGHLAEVGVVLQLGAEELAGHVEVLATDDNDLLAGEKLLGDDGSQATEKVALAVNDDL